MKHTKLLFTALFIIFCLGVFNKIYAETFLVTNTNDSGAGSFRQALLNANVNGQSDIINFDMSVFSMPQTITLTSGDLVIANEGGFGNIKSLTINGPGADKLTISGNNLSRVFRIQLYAEAIIDGVKITGGNGKEIDSGPEYNSKGGGIFVEGGAFPDGNQNLILSNSIITGNESVTNIAHGGGILLFGRVTIINSAITNNYALQAGGGISNPNAEVTLINSTVSNNTASGTAGINLNGGRLNLINSVVAFNRSLVGGNAGINTAEQQFVSTNFYARNSIIANNTGISNFAPDIFGPLKTGSNNIIGNTSGTTIFPEVTGNQLNVDPQLNPNFSTNGLGIPFHTVSAGSPAIDRGDNCVLTATTNGGCINQPLTSDIRGVMRPQDGDGNGAAFVDIGSFEATAAEVSSAPNKADLQAANDTGISSTDNITTSRNLAFDVNNVTIGATVEFYRNGTLLESITANGNTVTFSDNNLPADGTFSYSSRQIIENAPSLFSETLFVIIDNTAPTVTINQASGQADPTRFQPINFAIAFSETVAGFDSADVSLAGSTAGVSSANINLTGTNSAFVAEISNITSDGQVRASLPANSVQDIAGNFNAESTAADNIVTLDTTSPTVTINQAAAQMDPTRNLPVNFTVIFSEAVTGFTNADISLSGSTANVASAFISITGSGAVYNVAVSGINSNGGFVRATVITNAAIDAAGNSSTASASTDNQVTVDNMSPTVTINQAVGQADPTNALPVNFTAVFSEPVTGFDTADISFSGSTISTSQAVITITGSGTTYNVAISGNLNSNGGAIQVGVRNGAAQDAVGNSSFPSSSTDNRVIIDNILPSVTINQSIGQADPTSTQPLAFTVVFSENVTGFTASDISLNGSTANISSANINISGNGSVYFVSISNITSSGLVRASVVANAAQDAIGNLSLASTSSDNTISFRLIKSLFDFDGDAKTDIGIFRPSVGEWWYLRSSDFGNYAVQFGTSTDQTVPADYTGDGKTDIAFWRESTGEWFILRSEDSSFYAFPFGSNDDIPAPGDFDGDGKADAAVFRPGDTTWYIKRSSDNGVTIQQFGIAEDLPVVADYDGDGKADIAIFRPSVSEWWLLRSTAGLQAVQFGQAGDKTVQGDYTGDGKADIAFWRPSNGFWYILRSEDNSFFAYPFGSNGDIPTPGDYDGDGKADAAVFRPSNSTWYLQRSTSGFLAIGFGINGDQPIPSAFVR